MGTPGALASVVDQAAAALGLPLVPAWAVWSSGQRCSLPLDGALARAGVVLVPVWGPASVRCGIDVCCMPFLAPLVLGAYPEVRLRVLVGWCSEV